MRTVFLKTEASTKMRIVAYLKGDLVDSTEISKVFFLEIRMALILENRRQVFLGLGQNFSDLSQVEV